MIRVDKNNLSGSRLGFNLSVHVEAGAGHLSSHDFYLALCSFATPSESVNIRQIELVNTHVKPTEYWVQCLLTALRLLPSLYLNPIIFTPRDYEWLLKSNLDKRNALIESVRVSHKSLMATYKERCIFFNFLDSLVNNQCVISFCSESLSQEIMPTTSSTMQVLHYTPTPKQKVIFNLAIWLSQDESLSEDDVIADLLDCEPFSVCGYETDWLIREHSTVISLANSEDAVGYLCRHSEQRECSKSVPFITVLLSRFNYLPADLLLQSFLKDAEGRALTIADVDKRVNQPSGLEQVALFCSSGYIVETFEDMLAAGYHLLKANSSEVLLTSIVSNLFALVNANYFARFLPALLPLLMRSAKQQGSVDETMATASIRSAYHQFLTVFFAKLRCGHSFGYETAFSKAVLLGGQRAAFLCDLGASPDAIPNPRSGLTLIGQATLYQRIMKLVTENTTLSLEELPPDLLETFKVHFSRILTLCRTDRLKSEFWDSYTVLMKGDYQASTELRLSSYIDIIQGCSAKLQRQASSPGLFRSRLAVSQSDVETERSMSFASPG